MTRNALRWLGGLLVLYLVAPLVFFVERFVSGPERGFHVGGLWPALLISLSTATVSLALICLFGIPLAYVLARSTSAWSRVVEIAVTLPLALPPVMGGLIVVYLVGPYSFLGTHVDSNLTNSVYGIVIAMTFTSAPFLILAARAAFEVVDPALLDVAATLGHGAVSRLVRVAIPAAGPGIRAGMTMTWLRAFGEYGAVTILAYNPASLPIYTVNEFMARGLAPTLAPTMLALVVAALVVALSRARLPRRGRIDVSDVVSEAPALTPSARLRFHVAHRVGSFALDLAHEARFDNVAVLGASGSGKSVLVRALAGLYGSNAGTVIFGDTDVSALPPERRRVGYVAQGFSLFPHLTVWQNMMFPTRARAPLARYWLEHLRLAGLENRLPSQLSGGQRQRVALAQTLCSSPDVLLLDEPFSALDMPIRRELQRELRHLQRETGLATLIVTHDPAEAAFLAGEIMVIDAGRLRQSDANRQLFSRPVSPDVARLLGVTNLFSARTTPTGLVTPGGTRLALDVASFAPQSEVLWSVRPEAVIVHGDDASDGFHDVDEPVRRVAVRATLADVADVGTGVELFVTLDAELELHARASSAPDLAVGDDCWVRIDVNEINVWLDPSGVTRSPADLTNDASASPHPRG